MSPQNMPFGHIGYFELNVLEKQPVQDTLNLLKAGGESSM